MGTLAFANPVMAGVPPREQPQAPSESRTTPVAAATPRSNDSVPDASIDVPAASVDQAVKLEGLGVLGDEPGAATIETGDGLPFELGEQLSTAEPAPPVTTRPAIPFGPVPTRRTFVRGADATVMLAATIDDASQGTLDPVRAVDGSVLHWKVRAANARDYFGICDDDPTAASFAEPTVGTCTGVFVGPDLVLTAGHCVDAIDSVANLRVVLDYSAEQGAPSQTLAPENVRSVVLDSRSTEPGKDWAVLRIVDGEFPDRVVPLCRPTDNCGGRAGIWSIGHPLGVSRRFLPKHRIVRRTENLVLTDLDTYVGSSGSPVYDRSAQRVLGIVVSGRPDFVATRRGCRRFANMHRPGARRIGEVVLLVDALPTSLLRRLLPWQSNSRRVVPND